MNHNRLATHLIWVWSGCPKSESGRILSHVRQAASHSSEAPARGAHLCLSLRPFMSAATTNLPVAFLLGISSSFPHGSTGSGPSTMSNIPEASHPFHATAFVPAPSSASAAASYPSLSSLDILTQAATGRRPPPTEEFSARPVLSVYASPSLVPEKSPAHRYPSVCPLRVVRRRRLGCQRTGSTALCLFARSPSPRRRSVFGGSPSRSPCVASTVA